MPEEIVRSNNPKSKFNLSLDYRFVILLLIGVIIAMAFIWKPWHKTTTNNNDRVISVTGEAKVTAEPDEYVFMPSYQFQGTDKTAVLSELTKKSDEILTKLKSLGVKDSEIKTNSSGNDRYYSYYYDPGTKLVNYNLSLTITLSDRSNAQKIQDYLVTTNPTGAVSPQANFSDIKRKELETQARDKATKEARAKADQSAKSLGFKIGAVKSVQDGTGFGGQPFYDKATIAPMAAGDSTQAQLGVQPGQNDLSYTVSVVYFLR